MGYMGHHPCQVTIFKQNNKINNGTWLYLVDWQECVNVFGWLLYSQLIFIIMFIFGNYNFYYRLNMWVKYCPKYNRHESYNVLLVTTHVLSIYVYIYESQDHSDSNN